MKSFSYIFWSTNTGHAAVSKYSSSGGRRNQQLSPALRESVHDGLSMSDRVSRINKECSPAAA